MAFRGPGDFRADVRRHGTSPAPTPSSANQIELGPRATGTSVGIGGGQRVFEVPASFLSETARETEYLAVFAADLDFLPAKVFIARLKRFFQLPRMLTQHGMARV